MRKNELKKTLLNDILSAHVFSSSRSGDSSSRSGDRGPGKVPLCCLESSG